MTYNVALFGAGRIGRIHAANIASHRDLELTHIVDPMSSNAESIARDHGGRVSTIDATLADASVDGVIIASSTDAHLDHCLAAHRAGKAIFCEKPVDMDLVRAEAAATELSSARLFVGFNRRFDPNFKALKSRLIDGTVGQLETLQITSNDPTPPPIDYVRTSGGLLKDMSIHDFDMARHLLDDEPSEVFAWGSCLIDPAIGEAGDIDTARIVLRTASGRLCVIANSRRSGFGYDQRIEAFGSAGMVKADNEHESTVSVWSEGGARSDGFRNFFLDRYAEAYRAEISHFAEILGGRENAAVTYADGVAALRLAEAASRSLATGRPVSIIDSQLP